MAETLALRVEGGITSKMLIANKNWTIHELSLKVADIMGVRDTPVSYYLTYQGDILRHKSRKLGEYQITHCSTIQFHVARYRKKAIEPLPGYIELTDDPCCVMYDDSEMEMRVKMPCGCALATGTLMKAAKETLDKGDCQFKCPNCDKNCEYFLVRHVLSQEMTGEELEMFDEQIDKNFMVKPEQDFNQCGMCKSYCMRDFTKRWQGNRYRVNCQVCTKEKGHVMDFCWICGEQWKGSSSCGNKACENVEADRLKTLAECKTKTIGGVKEVPEYRACPRCGIFIHHIDACKHMTCKCGCNFCFICLKTQDGKGQWQCGSYKSECPVAPRQTVLPR